MSHQTPPSELPPTWPLLCTLCALFKLHFFLMPPSTRRRGFPSSPDSLAPAKSFHAPLRLDCSRSIAHWSTSLPNRGGRHLQLSLDRWLWFGPMQLSEPTQFKRASPCPPKMELILSGDLNFFGQTFFGLLSLANLCLNSGGGYWAQLPFFVGIKLFN